MLIAAYQLKTKILSFKIMKTLHSILVSFKPHGIELKSLSYRNDLITFKFDNNLLIDEQAKIKLTELGFTVKSKSYIGQGMFILLVKEFKPLNKE